MSTESPERRYSRGGSIYNRRLRTLANRRTDSAFTPQKKQERMTVASWSAACGLMNLAAINNPELRSIFEGERTRPVLREWHAACVLDKLDSNGKETTARDAVREKYAPDTKAKRLQLTVLDVVTPLAQVIDRAVFGQRAAK